MIIEETSPDRRPIIDYSLLSFHCQAKKPEKGDAGINEKEFDGAGIHPGQERVHVGLGSRHHRRLQQHD